MSEPQKKSVEMEKVLVHNLTILNQRGLYTRPAVLVVKALSAYLPDTTVTISCGETCVKGTSPLGLLSLEGYQGSVLTVEARGPKAKEALEAVTELVNAGFYSDE